MQEQYTCSIKDAVSRFGLSRDVIYNLINDQKIESCRVGGRRLVFIESVKNFLRAQREDTYAG